MGDIVLLENKQQREQRRWIEYQYNRMSFEQRRHVIARIILEFNDRRSANIICGKKLNDIEFQQFKNMLKQYV